MKKFLSLLLVALLAFPVAVEAKKKKGKKKKGGKKKSEAVKYERVTFAVKVDTEYQGEGTGKKKVYVFNMSARNPNKGDAAGMGVEVFAIFKHKDKSGVYSMEQLTVGGNKGINIKGGGKWVGKTQTKDISDKIVYYDYVAVLSNGGKELRKVGSSQWKRLLDELVGMQKGDTFNSRGELLEAGDIGPIDGGGDVAADDGGKKKKGGGGAAKKKKGGNKKKKGGGAAGGGAQ